MSSAFIIGYSSSKYNERLYYMVFISVEMRHYQISGLTLCPISGQSFIILSGNQESSSVGARYYFLSCQPNNKWSPISTEISTLPAL